MLIFRVDTLKPKWKMISKNFIQQNNLSCQSKFQFHRFDVEIFEIISIATVNNILEHDQSNAFEDL